MERDTLVGDFVLAKNTTFNITQDGATKSKHNTISKRERVYFTSQKHDPKAPIITSIPHTSSKICPVKDHCPMTFNFS